MKCSEIMDVCRKLAPEDCACDWDNPGLLAGRSDKEVKKIYIALDATDKVVEAAQALGADMLLTHQKIWFLDEPTYGQDFENRQELMKDMEKLVEEGITIVMITHDLSLVRQYATRVVELEEGSVKKALPTEEYFAWREAGERNRKGGR